MNLGLTMKVDMATLERSLTKARKGFGESSEQAIYRWGVQVARELAGVTQAFGKGKKSNDIQRKAIYMDAFNVVKITQGRPSIKNAKDCEEWIQRHRTRAGRRTVVLPENAKKSVTIDVLNQALAADLNRASMAKGAWLGSGEKLSNRQTGMQKANLGKNFLPMAAKWASLGSSTVKRNLFKPSAQLNNNTKHSAERYVLPHNRKTTVVKRALINTLKWYNKATTAKLAKA